MKYTITTILILIAIVSSSSQSKFELEARGGFIFFDRKSNPDAPDDILYGYGLQSDIGVWQKLRINKYFNTRFGIGFSNFYYLDKSPILDFETRDG